jgi:hypothetical protein
MPIPAKTLTVETAAASPDWQVIPGASGAETVSCRLNSAFRRARDRSAYPVRVTASVRLHYVNSIGSPVLPYSADLAAVADAVIQAVAEGAAPGVVLVAVITKLTSVEFVLYAEDERRAAEARQMVEAAAGGQPVTVQTGRDARWKGYRLLVRQGRQARIGLMLLPFFPLLAGAMVYGHYGSWWGLAEAIACAAWILPWYVLYWAKRPARRRAGAPAGRAATEPAGKTDPASTRQRGRSAVGGRMFALVAAVLTTLFFSLVALLAGAYLAPVVSLAVAAAAGLLLTAAVWPAQRRFTAMMRSRQPPTGHTGTPGA